jgi:hypothetical protein
VNFRNSLSTFDHPGLNLNKPFSNIYEVLSTVAMKSTAFCDVV